MKNLNSSEEIRNELLKDMSGELTFAEQVNLYAAILRKGEWKNLPGHTGRVANNMINDGLINPETLLPIPENVESFFTGEYSDDREGTTFVS